MITTRNRKAPYIHTENNSAYSYFRVGLALIPCFSYAVFYYGLRALMLVAVCVLTTVFTAFIFDRYRENREYYDISSIVNGVILALLLPAGTPIYVAVISALLSEMLFKQAWGGFGANPINVAAMGRIIAQLMWPIKMEQLMYPGTDRLGLSGVITKYEADFDIPDLDQVYFMEIVAGKIPGMIGTGCAILIIISGLYLLIHKLNNVQVSFAYLFTVTLFYMLLVGGSDFKKTIVFLLSSGVIFATVFLLGDVVTIPNCSKEMSSIGMMSYGALAGLLTVLLEKYQETIGSSVSVRFTLVICVPVIVVNIIGRVMEYIFSCHPDDPDKIDESDVASEDFL